MSEIRQWPKVYDLCHTISACFLTYAMCKECNVQRVQRATCTLCKSENKLTCMTVCVFTSATCKNV